jgi:class 3 adenylate cyclase
MSRRQEPDRGIGGSKDGSTRLARPQRKATHTVLFPDLVGSTRLWQSNPAKASVQLHAEHRYDQ